MTVLTGVVVAAVASAGLAAPVVTAPALSGIVAGSASAASAATGTATAAAGTATAITSSTAAGAAGSTALIASGPVGWLVLGAEDAHPVAAGATFDCWKPVVRDRSTQLSNGKLLKEIFEDQRIKEVIVRESDNKFNLPELSLVNIWDEQFDINYFVLPYNNQLVAHAVRVA